MALAYFDCFAGAAGDMIVAALLDAGCDLEALRKHLATLPLEGTSVRAEPAARGGLAGTRFVVECAPEERQHRRLGDITALINAADLPPRAAGQAKRVFERLAAAEAKAHGIRVEDVHFHEVGAVDSIIDVVAACVSLELLNVDRVVSSPIALASGQIECAHGTLPLPAPATARLAVGAAVAPSASPGEATTPTAAALLTTLAERFGPVPPMSVTAVGYGAGSRDEGPLPNLLRVFIGRPDDEGAADTVVELSANIDDATGEMIGAAIDRLLAAGCLDAWAAPIVMKKSRPAWMLSALAAPADADEAERILFAETTTFGVRRRPAARAKLEREHRTVETPYGPVRMKLGRRGGQVVTASPEFSDCLSAAEVHHVSVKDVLAAASAAWQEAHP